MLVGIFHDLHVVRLALHQQRGVAYVARSNFLLSFD